MTWEPWEEEEEGDVMAAAGEREREDEGGS